MVGSDRIGERHAARDVWPASHDGTSCRRRRTRTARAGRAHRAHRYRAGSCQTALTEALAEVRKSEAELRTIVDMIPQLIAVLAPDGQALYVNQSTLEYTGLSPDQARGFEFRQRTQAPRFQLCWIDSHLRTHASGRHGQRSLNRLLSISRRPPARDADIDMSTVSKGILQERQPFDVAWRTIDGLKIRYATDGKGDEKVVLFSPWPEGIFAFFLVWSALTRRF